MINHIFTIFKSGAELTLLIGRVLHLVGAVSQISDQSFRLVAWRVIDWSLDMIATRFWESTSIHSEIGSGLPENTYRQTFKVTK